MPRLLAGEFDGETIILVEDGSVWKWSDETDTWNRQTYVARYIEVDSLIDNDGWTIHVPGSECG